MRKIILQIALVCLLASAGEIHAERYLTISQAQKLLFPTAEKFEEHVIRFSPEQKKAIEKKSGIPVKNIGNRFWVARKGSEMIGVLVADHVLGKHEIIDYAIALSPEGTIQQIEILEYRESHGGQIRGEKWRNQFKGKNADNRLQLNEDIYNISGATMSCRHVTEGVKRVLAAFEFMRPLFAGELPNGTAQKR